MPLTERSVGRSIADRARIVADLMRQLEKRKSLDNELQNELLKAAPESLRPWLIEECIVGSLFEHGQAALKIVFDRAPFGELKQVQEVIAALKKAWRSVVKIELEKNPEPHRIAVRFTPVM